MDRLRRQRVHVLSDTCPRFGAGNDRRTPASGSPTCAEGVVHVQQCVAWASGRGGKRPGLPSARPGRAYERCPAAKLAHVTPPRTRLSACSHLRPPVKCLPDASASRVFRLETGDSVAHPHTVESAFSLDSGYHSMVYCYLHVFVNQLAKGSVDNVHKDAQVAKDDRDIDTGSSDRADVGVAYGPGSELPASSVPKAQGLGRSRRPNVRPSGVCQRWLGSRGSAA